MCLVIMTGTGSVVSTASSQQQDPGYFLFFICLVTPACPGIESHGGLAPKPRLTLPILAKDTNSI